MKIQILNDLGLAYRAKKILFSEDMLKNMKDVKLIFQASDSSDKSKLRIDKKIYFYQIPLIREFTSQEISRALGRRNIRLLGITDEGMAKTILKKL